MDKYTEKTAKDNQDLIAFWDEVFSYKEDTGEKAPDPEGWKQAAPSGKLFMAASSLGLKEKVLDYGCGSGWAGIIAAKEGCRDVTAVDAAKGAIEKAKQNAKLYEVDRSVRAFCIETDWLQSVPAETYDGLICSNVLDVIPPETAKGIIREFARICRKDASVIIGLNYYLSPERAKEKGIELEDGCRVYMNGILRLVSRTDEEWAGLFAPWFKVEKLEHFAWPGEKMETRRLFYLNKQ